MPTDSSFKCSPRPPGAPQRRRACHWHWVAPRYSYVPYSSMPTPPTRRLGRVAVGLGAAGAARHDRLSAGGDAVLAVPEPPRFSLGGTRLHLLTDEQMCHFVSKGFLSLPLAPAGDPLHSSILQRCEQLGIEGEHSAPPNQQRRNQKEPTPAWSPPFEVFNVHPRIAGMEQVLYGPVLRGALTSVLGEDYALNAHRSVAFGGSSVSTHKDAQRWPMVVHRPRTVYVFYLPAGASLEMCPTAIIPESHWLSRDQGADNPGPGADWRDVVASAENLAPGLSEHMCTAPPWTGTAVLLHSAIFHRGTLPLVRLAHGESPTGLPRRPMIKLIFNRTRAPSTPTWSHRPNTDVMEMLRADNSTDPALFPAVTSVWNWLRCGSSSARDVAAGGVGLSSQEVVEEPVAALKDIMMEQQRDGDEALRVGAGYRLAAACTGQQDAKEALLAALDGGTEAGKRVAVQALGAAGKAVVRQLIARVGALAAQAREGPRGKGEQQDEDDFNGQLFEAVSNCALALGEAGSEDDCAEVDTAAAIHSLVDCAAAVRDKAYRLDQTGSVNPFGPRPGATGALASCIVAMDHIGQRCVSNEFIDLCMQLVDALLPVCMQGVDDMLRGEQDAGRGHSRRECVLAAEAIRNLCLLGPALSSHRPALSRSLLEVSKSLTTSARLRGAAMEALSNLTRRHANDGTTSCSLPSVRDELVQRLVEARFVTDGSGMGLRPNPQSTNEVAKYLRK